MGMAASQARLLCITARIHDVEYQAQAIQNAKIQLATHEDKAYQEYNDALNDTTLTIATMDPVSGAKSNIAANFNNLCSRNRVMAANGSSYVMHDKNGYLIVEDDIEEAYYDFTEAGLNDPYQFAMFMLNDGNVQHIGNLENGDFADKMQNYETDVYNNLTDEEKSKKLKNYETKLLELCGGTDIYDTDDMYSNADDKTIEEYEKTLELFRKELYRKQGAEIYAATEGDPEAAENFNSTLFNFYVNIYNQIEASDGCVAISDFNGGNGDAANDSTWLKGMVESGQITISTVGTDDDGDTIFNAASPSSDSCLGYTTTTTIDNRALAAAEAKYERTLKQIDKKDKQFDLELSKLETERTALTTEYESVKKVIEDNIDRSFGIFS